MTSLFGKAIMADVILRITTVDDTKDLPIHTPILAPMVSFISRIYQEELETKGQKEMWRQFESISILTNDEPRKMNRYHLDLPATGYTSTMSTVLQLLEYAYSGRPMPTDFVRAHTHLIILLGYGEFMLENKYNENGLQSAVVLVTTDGLLFPFASLELASRVAAIDISKVQVLRYVYGMNSYQWQVRPAEALTDEERNGMDKYHARLMSLKLYVPPPASHYWVYETTAMPVTERGFCEHPRNRLE